MRIYYPNNFNYLINIESWGGIMASRKEYLQFILEQLSDLEEITYRSMMGEFIIYYRGKIVGGIYDELPVPKVRKKK